MISHRTVRKTFKDVEISVAMTKRRKITPTESAITKGPGAKSKKQFKAQSLCEPLNLTREPVYKFTQKIKALSKLNIIWSDWNISLSSDIRVPFLDNKVFSNLISHELPYHFNTADATKIDFYSSSSFSQDPPKSEGILSKLKLWPFSPGLSEAIKENFLA